MKRRSWRRVGLTAEFFAARRSACTFLSRRSRSFTFFSYFFWFGASTSCSSTFIEWWTFFARAAFSCKNLTCAVRSAALPIDWISCKPCDDPAHVGHRVGTAVGLQRPALYAFVAPPHPAPNATSGSVGGCVRMHKCVRVRACVCARGCDREITCSTWSSNCSRSSAAESISLLRAAPAHPRWSATHYKLRV